MSGSWRSSFKKIKSVEESNPRAIDPVLCEIRLTAPAIRKVFPTCHQTTNTRASGLKEAPTRL
jgi:hypothetical protein